MTKGDADFEPKCRLQDFTVYVTVAVYENYIEVSVVVFRMQSVQNLGLAVVAIINGIIVDMKGYFILEIFLLAWLCGQCYGLHFMAVL